MRNKAIFITIVMITLTVSIVNAELPDSNRLLQIYLPRDIAISGNLPTLGSIAIVSGPRDRMEKVEKIAMGRISTPEQIIVIDRATVLSRLVANGIPTTNVKLTGAEKISVTQKHQRIKSDYFVKQAQEFLEKNLPNPSICQWTPTRSPKEMILPGSWDDITADMALVPIGLRNQAKIKVSILSGGKVIDTRDIAFRLKFESYKLLAKTDMSYGDLITPQNVELQKVILNYPDSANWAKPLYAEISGEKTGIPSKGLVVKRKLTKGSIINSGIVGPPLPKVILEKNQSVLIKIDKFGLVITAKGKALQDGRQGQCIKIQNVDSERIIMARVAGDGTVEPVF